MPDPVEAARIQAAARARIVWPAASPDQIARGEEALRVYFLAKGVMPYEAWTASNWLESEANYETEFALPVPANDAPMAAQVPTADDLKAKLWLDAREIAWRSIGRPVTTVDGRPPWEFDVQIAFDHRAYLAATGEDYVLEICGCIDEPAARAEGSEQ